jgi:hypothetical protein
MADKIVSWGGFDSKGTDGMGVTGSFSVSGSITANSNLSLTNSTSSLKISLGTTSGSGVGAGGELGRIEFLNGTKGSVVKPYIAAYQADTFQENTSIRLVARSWSDEVITADFNNSTISLNRPTTISGSLRLNDSSATVNLGAGLGNSGGVTFNSGAQGFKFVSYNMQLYSVSSPIITLYTAAGSNNVGINTTSDLSAKLAVKGSGTTSSTTSFLVQNSNATASLTIKDDLSITAAGSIILQQPGSSNTITINPTGSNFLRYYQAGAFEGNLMAFSAGIITFPNSVNFTNGLVSSGFITTNNIGVDNSNTNRFIRFWKSGVASRVTITHTDAGTLQFRVFDSYDDTTGGVGMYITQQGNAGLTGSLTVGSLSNLSEDQRMSITNPGTYYGDMFGLTLPSSFDPGVMYQVTQGGTNWNGQIASGSNIITSYPAGISYNPNYASYISVGDYVRDANSGFRARVLTVSATTMSLDRNIAVSYTGSNYTFWPRAYGHTAGTLVYNTTTNKVNYWTTSSLNVLLDSSGSQAITGSLTISGSNAAVTMPSRPAFRVVGAGTTNNLTVTQNGDGTLNQNNWTVDYQQGSALTGSTGVFTAPLAGLYQISLVGRNSGYSSGVSQLAVVKYFGASNAVQAMVEWASSSTMNHAGGSSITYMNAGDLLRLKVLAGEINFDINDNWSVAYIG